jgi:hypothetical protein
MRFRKPAAWLGLWILAILVAVGTVRAFTRNGNDFSVFYEAWRLVASGRGAEIYRVSPDRFLYCPGFAWLLSPLGFLSKSTALGLWCVSKVVLIGFLIRKLSEPWRVGNSITSMGISAWGAVLVSRPLLIDLEYGQVNLLILAACIWALTGHFDGKSSPKWDSARWVILAFAAVAKLFPTPLLLVPWFVTSGIPAKKLRFERIAVILGAIVTLLIPVLSLGWGGTWNLLVEWRGAVLARGLPMESHNQSFAALLYHYLSGNPTFVLSEGTLPLQLGGSWLSPEQIVFFSLFWTMASFGTILGWIVSGSFHPSMKWMVLLIGLLIVPSHLVWKPYFVMSLPMAVFIANQTLVSHRLRDWLIFMGLFVGINLTGFDFLGHHWAAHLEAASILLLMHLVMMAVVASQSCQVRASVR